jgi:hypothetical protein
MHDLQCGIRVVAINERGRVVDGGFAILLITEKEERFVLKTLQYRAALPEMRKINWSTDTETEVML